MTSLACRQFRSAALDRSAKSSGESGEHAATCAACALWLKRLSGREELIRSLPRVVAPEDLMGRVVASFHAGERQARAVRALRGLGRVEMPADLERAVEARAREAAAQDPLPEIGGRVEAPSVLVRLIQEELQDPAKARSARFLGSLPRVQAPAELAERLAAELARPARPALRVGVWVAFAAALVLAMCAPILFPSAIKRRPFRVEHSDSLADLSPFSRALLDTASSGMLPPRKS